MFGYWKKKINDFSRGHLSARKESRLDAQFSFLSAVCIHPSTCISLFVSLFLGLMGRGIDPHHTTLREDQSRTQARFDRRSGLNLLYDNRSIPSLHLSTPHAMEPSVEAVEAASSITHLQLFFSLVLSHTRIPPCSNDILLHLTLSSN